MTVSRPPMRMLLVEDNPADERLLRAVLRGHSAEGESVVITWARTLAEAIERVSPKETEPRRRTGPSFEVALLDLGLPDSQGLPTLRGLRQAAPDLPIVVLTGIEDPELGVEAVSAGAQDALIKGTVDPSALWRALGHAIERHRAENEVRRLNAELEARVRERTRELAVANEQLEAFAHSASHDLKAPLRSVEGMVSLLVSDHAHQIDHEGRGLLERIQRSVQRMDTLIDALLKLSLLGRRGVTRTRLDLSHLARRELQELLEQYPHRIIAFHVADAITAEADEQLLQIVLQNLLGNALKFTAHTEDPQAEVGVLRHETLPVYFVRDNGAGFDMRYADKLFRPFTRLHGAEQYPGMGIGLATVQRIVHMHGGEVWAEGEPGHGACFFFTLAPAG